MRIALRTPCRANTPATSSPMRCASPCTSASTDGPAPDSATATSAGSSRSRISARPGIDARPVRLVQLVAHGGAQQVEAAGGERGAEQRGALHVVDRVGARVRLGHQAARLRRRQRHLRHDDHRRGGGRREPRDGEAVVAERGDHRAAVPRRQRVVGVPFQLGDRAREHVVVRRPLDEPRADRDAERARGGAAAEARRRAGSRCRASTVSGGAAGAMRATARSMQARKPPCVGASAPEYVHSGDAPRRVHAHVRRHAQLERERDGVETRAEVRARRGRGNREAAHRGGTALTRARATGRGTMRCRCRARSRSRAARPTRDSARRTPCL